MKICAITMVYRDDWALKQWYSHFGRHLGHENLFIVAHGADPNIQRLCPKANVFTIPRDSLAHFDRMRSQMLNGFQDGLGALYDWVIRTDVDELICLDPTQHDSFASFFAQQTGNSVFALGLNVAESPDDGPLQEDAPALSSRKNAVFSAHYSKAWAVRNRVGLFRHGILIRPRFVAKFDFKIPRGVYLAHLKFANSQALQQSDRHRRDIANHTEKGLPGKAWKAPNAENRRFYKMFETLPVAPWEEAEAKAYADISVNPVRDPKKGFIRTRNTRQSQRVVLPDWFSKA